MGVGSKGVWGGGGGFGHVLARGLIGDVVELVVWVVVVHVVIGGVGEFWRTLKIHPLGGRFTLAMD